MKVGILTFHSAFNYGSMLQAWALQKVLSEMGHDVEIINFQTQKQKQMYRKPFASTNLKYLLGDFSRLIKFGAKYLSLRSRWNNFDKFMRCNMLITKEFNKKEWINEKKNYDAIITGSDQIWNLIAYDFSNVFLGEGVDDRIRLIAYGPSLGPDPANLDAEVLKSYLNRYFSVAVRESGARDFILSHRIFPNVDIVLDPTLLLRHEDYRPFISDHSPLAKEYVYYYTPGKHDDIIGKAKQISSKIKLPIVTDTGYSRTYIYTEDLTVTEAGPSEFLSYISHSELVVGASFHLIVFAILLHKDFICINGDKDERLRNLLYLLGLQHRIQSIADEKINDCPESIDWDAVDQRLSLLRSQSLNYLTKSLE